MPVEIIERELLRGEAISIINIVDCLIQEASDNKASDIHIDPTRDAMRVRMRVDGVLRDTCSLPREIRSEIIARIKVLAHLRTDEHQMPQDGRFRHVLPHNDVLDIRVSIAPTYHGENVVLRLLSSSTENHSLEALGFSETDARRISDAVHKRGGMILVTGPTGSGKTTTLYTIMRMLNAPEVALVSIEDPIEYSINGAEQLQVNPRTGLTFGSGLRTILRQDPDIIMVGEIRDAETASISINTALTGHLLLSTLHTHDAATTIPRLIDLSAESFLIASTLRLAIGQRLVRSICRECKEEVPITADVVRSLSHLPVARMVKRGRSVYRGRGCGACKETGFSGRLCIAECLPVEDTVREAILRRVSAAELKRLALKAGMSSMLEDGFRKVLSGDTTIEEVLRVVHE